DASDPDDFAVRTRRQRLGADRATFPSRTSPVLAVTRVVPRTTGADGVGDIVPPTLEEVWWSDRAPRRALDGTIEWRERPHRTLGADLPRAAVLPDASVVE